MSVKGLVKNPLKSTSVDFFGLQMRIYLYLHSKKNMFQMHKYMDDSPET